MVWDLEASASCPEKGQSPSWGCGEAEMDMTDRDGTAFIDSSHPPTCLLLLLVLRTPEAVERSLVTTVSKSLICRVGLGTGPKMLMLLDSGPVSVALLSHA